MVIYCVHVMLPVKEFRPWGKKIAYTNISMKGSISIKAEIYISGPFEKYL